MEYIYQILTDDIILTILFKINDSSKKHIKKLIFNDYRAKAKNMIIDKYQDLKNN